MPQDTYTLDDGDSLIVYGKNLNILDRDRSFIEIRAGRINPRPGGPPPTDPPPEPEPEPEPLPEGDNLLANGRLEDEDGNASLAGWEQEPNWFNTHAPVKGSPSGTHYIQADRDFRPGVVNVWKGGNPSTAMIHTVTAADLPEHEEIWLRWEVAHHMKVGEAVWELHGQGKSGAWYLARTGPITGGTPGDKRPRVVELSQIDVMDGGFRRYELRAVVTLASDEDGIVFGDVRLTVK